MSFLNQQQLSAIYHEGLYRILEDEAVGKTVTIQKKPENMGVFTDPIAVEVLVLHLMAETASLSKETDFLIKILHAVNLTEDRYVVKMVPLGENLSEWIKSYAAKIIMVFGLENLSFEDEILNEKYQFIKLKSTNFLLADFLSKIEEDVEKKKALWKALKSFFK